MSMPRIYSLAAAAALVLTAACQSTQSGDTDADGTPRTSTGNATDSTSISSDSLGTPATPSAPGTPPSSPSTPPPR